MKSLILAVLVSFAMVVHAGASTDSLDLVSAKKGKKSEPAPKDRDERTGGEETPDSREETYEGNDRGGGGGSFDGGGYDGGGGGMAGELFYAPTTKTYPVTSNVKTEDRGDVIIYTTTIQEDISASETCTKIVVTVVDKKTKKVLSTDSDEFCNHWPL